MTILRIILTLVAGGAAEGFAHNWVLALVAAITTCWLLRPKGGRAFVVTDLTNNTTRVIETRSGSKKIKL